MVAGVNFARIRFELGCKTPPNLDKSANPGAKRPFLFGKLRFCEAKPICFSGGRIGLQARGGALFWFLATAGGFWYNERATNLKRKLLFMAQIAVSDSSGLLGLVAPVRLFKFQGGCHERKIYLVCS